MKILSSISPSLSSTYADFFKTNAAVAIWSKNTGLKPRKPSSLDIPVLAFLLPCDFTLTRFYPTSAPYMPRCKSIPSTPLSLSMT